MGEEKEALYILDEVDRKILNQLINDSRKPYQEIARELISRANINLPCLSSMPFPE